MAKENNLKDLLTDVADAIREKKGTTELINPQDFGKEIREIEADGVVELAEEMVDNTGNGITIIKNIIVKKGVTKIAPKAYANTAIQTIQLPEGLETIGNASFNSCTGLTSIVIPNSVTSIESRAFIACSNLIEVNLPPKLTILSGESFQTCDISVPLIIPSGITTIGARAFYANEKIPYFDFRNHVFIPALASENVFSSTGSARFIVPDSLYDDWIKETNWVTYAERIVKASEFVEPANE